MLFHHRVHIKARTPQKNSYSLDKRKFLSIVKDLYKKTNNMNNMMAIFVPAVSLLLI